MEGRFSDEHGRALVKMARETIEGSLGVRKGADDPEDALLKDPVMGRKHGVFVTLTKQAKPLGYFDAIKYNFIGAGEIASPETTKAMGAEYPVGIWGNSYDAFYWQEGPKAHHDYTARLAKFLKDDAPSSWSIQTYIAMQFLVEAIKKAGSTDSDKVAKALLGLAVDTPHGKMTLREKDHQLNRGQLYGKTAKDPKYPFPIMKPMTYVDPSKFMD